MNTATSPFLRAVAISIVLLLAAPFARAITATTILTQGAITATGGQGEVDVSGLQGRGIFSLLGKSSNGTSPTAAVKLQHSDPATTGALYATVGTTVNKLRAGASTTVKLGAKFTQSGAASVKTVALDLKYVGTITAGKVVTLDIHTDNAGVPSATSLGTSASIDINTTVPTAAYGYVTFTFATPVDLSDATVYHMVLSGDYTASTSNYVSWLSNTVASAGNQSTNDATTWSAVATESFAFYAMQYSFADITGGDFTGMTTTSSVQSRQLNTDYLKAFVRTYVTIGGTSTPTFYLGCVLFTNDR